MRRLMLLGALFAVVATVWGCIEDIQPKTNNNPKIWFTRAPRNQGVIFQNGATFEWTATDTDDDLGMGQIWVRLDPYLECIVDTQTVCSPPEPCHDVVDTSCIYPVTLRDGWVRVYENTFDVANLPDTSYSFSVKVQDGRGADSILVDHFRVRFDNRPPIIDSVRCPPRKPASPSFQHTFIVYSHDVAANPASASPTDSLTYWYRFAVPSGGRSYETDDFARENRIFPIFIDGVSFPGIYKFRCKAKDRAGNVSQEYVCDFTIERGPR